MSNGIVYCIHVYIYIYIFIHIICVAQLKMLGNNTFHQCHGPRRHLTTFDFSETCIDILKSSNQQHTVRCCTYILTKMLQ